MQMFPTGFQPIKMNLSVKAMLAFKSKANGEKAILIQRVTFPLFWRNDHIPKNKYARAKGCLS